jgi:hypothetical protein
VLSWRHGDQDLDTGIRADDKTRYPEWIAAIEHEEQRRERERGAHD